MHDALTRRWAIAALLAASGLIWTAVRPVDEPLPRIVVATRVERVPQPVMIPGPPIVVRVSAPTPIVSAIVPCPKAPTVPAPPAAPRLSARQIAELANTEPMFDHFSELLGGMASAEGRPELAYAISRGDSGNATVFLSQDNGRRYAPVLRYTADMDSGVFTDIALDCAGRLYAVSGNALGVRDADGTERWQGFPLDEPAAREAWDKRWMTTVGPWVVWSAGGEMVASHDGGATWRDLGPAYDRYQVALVATQHALFARQAECVPDTLCFERLSPDTGERTAVRVRVHTAGTDGRISAIAGPDGWDLGVPCPRSADGYTACAENPSEQDLRWAATVAPDIIEGEARTHHEIVCTQSMPNVCFLVASDRTSRHIVASAPPGSGTLVDGRGEVFTGLYTDLLRWSPARGWR
ncbi:MAG: hypothetical protein K8W52_23135 [Deltaproteobacteria bacterium]|nr:hypothetical protein [Deltaproteobacteria bacterium]